MNKLLAIVGAVLVVCLLLVHFSSGGITGVGNEKSTVTAVASDLATRAPLKEERTSTMRRRGSPARTSAAPTETESERDGKLDPKRQHDAPSSQEVVLRHKKKNQEMPLSAVPLKSDLTITSPSSSSWDLRSVFPRPKTQRSFTETYRTLANHITTTFKEEAFRHSSTTTTRNGRGSGGAEEIVAPPKDDILLNRDRVEKINNNANELLQQEEGVPGAGGRGMMTSPPIWATNYRKINCGAIVTNFCLKEGQPRYYIKGKKSPTHGWATRVCNEAVSKYRLNLVMYEPELDPPYDYEPNSVLVIPFCWELYGYHQLLCLMSMFAHLEALKIPELQLRRGTSQKGGQERSNSDDERRLEVHLSLMKGYTETPFYIGSSKNWTERQRDQSERIKSNAKPSNYWELWHLIADRPDQVWTLPDTPTRCYSLGIFGAPSSTEATPEDAQAMRSAIVERLNLKPRNFRKCDAARVTLVLRKQYAIKNEEQVLEWLKGAVGTRGVVKTVYWEDLSLREQLQIAIETDLLVGVHGNGLSWSLMMPPHGAILELWPSHSYNANYKNFAVKANLAHFSTSGDGHCKERCPASYLNIPHVLPEVMEHLKKVACDGLRLNTTKEWDVVQMEKHRRKKEKQARGKL